ncbi:MAG TPA: MFS transporter [Mycobacteriales bacterium]|nr:MFS transporter [Mycobacteriales bacterium]
MTTTAEPARVVALPTIDTPLSKKQWFILGVLCFTVLLISLDQTVLNVALPTLVKDLHPSNSGLEWIVDSYTLIQAVLALLSGRLGDRFGHRRMFVVGSATFGVGSLGCALVHSTWPLVAMRVLTGLGAVALMPATLSIIVATFEGHHRVRAIGIWAGIGGVGGAAGPLVGGLLLQHFWWGSVFLINVPIAAIAVIGGLIAIKEKREADPAPVDTLGVLLSALGLSALTAAVIFAPTDRWGSRTVLSLIAASLVLLIAFYRWDSHRPEALIDFGLFRNAGFSSGIGAVTAMFFAMFGVSFLLSQYVQFVRGASVFGVGIRFLPLALGSMIGSNLSPRLMHRFGIKPTLLSGMTLVVAGLATLTALDVGTGYLLNGVAFGCVGFGMGLAIAPASNAVVSVLPADKVGIGSGLRTMLQWLGGAFGVAIVGSIATSHYRGHVDAAYATTLRGVPKGQRGAVSEQIGHAAIVARQLPKQLAEKVTSVTDHAFVGGMHLSSLVGLVVTFLAVIGVAVFMPNDIDIDEEEAKLASTG